jgi:hypothetical protein
MATTFELIETRTITTGTVSTFTFSSIPQTYQDLKIYIKGQALAPSNLYLDMRMRFNGDSATNYAAGEITATGSSFGSAMFDGTNGFLNIPMQGTNDANTSFAVYDIDLLNYADSTKVKLGTGNATLLSLNAPSSLIQYRLQSYLWKNTSAGISSIEFFTSVGTFLQQSVFSLYGIKKS